MSESEEGTEDLGSGSRVGCQQCQLGLGKEGAGRMLSWNRTQGSSPRARLSLTVACVCLVPSSVVST